MMESIQTLPALGGEINLADERGRILVVDDDTLVRTALEMTLKREGYDVSVAGNGSEAIAMMETNAFAIIICDQKMPGMSGIEVMERAQKLCPLSMRILLTASHDTETAINAINIGQVNLYLTKPWKDADLRKAVRTSLDRYKLLKENQVLQKLIVTQHDKLKKNHDILKQELKLGASIHEKLLLGKIPDNIPSLLIETLSIPSREIDGDFFEFYCPSRKHLDVVLGDVMGKGLAAALVGTAVKTEMVRFAAPSPATQFYDKKSGWTRNILTPEEVVNSVHRSISHKLIDLGYFVSLFYCRFDLQYKLLTFVDCGSPKPIHYCVHDRSICELEGSNYPLGILTDAHYHEKQVSYQPGDVFVFYSDGITEARSPQNDFFGTERLIDLIAGNSAESPKTIVKLIREAVRRFTAKDKPEDDLTLIVVKVGKEGNLDFGDAAQTSFDCSLSELKRVRDFVVRFCNKAPGDSERLGNELQLALNEAFTNIVKHGGGENSGKKILLQAELSEEGISLKLADQGPPFDPSEVNEPSFCGTRDTGYGWHIIRELSDQISYTGKETLNGWNQLILFKRFYFGVKRMDIAHSNKDDVLIITPVGNSLDAKDAPEFKEKVINLINEGNFNEVVFDLNELQFIDSSGLGSFLSILRILNARGGDLKLSRMNKPIRTMFELVKMHKIFEIFNATEDAVRSFK